MTVGSGALQLIRGVGPRIEEANVARASKLGVPTRIEVLAPPVGVMFALQRGKRELGAAATSTGADLWFDFTLLASRAAADGSLRFSGEFAQGRAGGQFVYVNSGTLARQAESCWTRRAKVGLQMLNWATVERVAAEPGNVLRARIAGVARDGGPACASVPLLDGGWTIVPPDESTSGRTRR
jgi:hypothetical protein